ncbi:uncharacterized protein BJ212DRAFT_1486289 [Suillus subaureus]|uniref:Uncharacterized protein n=1 Tax=Suillus subaureus TaxID=48587 RepID=A0A9P7DXE9_9AGAM|nr:uncharacterized protein BJ212DRAFT_1486289 [Suillus subaureus]KAG1805527.1 hypothetical protein BJ212DRAFT_1486289 [Suillus subaureus]
MVIPPLPQHRDIQVPIQLVPLPQPQPQHVNQDEAPVQAVLTFGEEGQGGYLPGLEPIESSDDEVGEDAVPDPPSPINVKEVGPPPLAEMHEEDEEEDMEDEMDDDFQFGGDGIMQVIVNDWFLPINSSTVHYIYL